MTAQTTKKGPAVAPAAPGINWDSVALSATVTDSVQPAKRKQVTDIPQVIRDLVDRLKGTPGTILAVGFPTEGHAKQAKTLINQYARMTNVDPAPQVYIQPDKITLHVRVPKAAAEAPAS